MSAQTPRERMLYNARIKFQRDEASKLLYAQREGIAEGKAIGKAEAKAEGQQIGVIHLLQELLALPETTEDELAGMSAESRDAVVEDLKIQLWKRGQLG